MTKDRPSASVSELEQGLSEADRLFSKGDRAAAIAEARRIVGQFPMLARTHRALSSLLSYKELSRYEDGLQEKLVADGSMQQALASARAALRLPDQSYEDYLQAGYCLTALGNYAEAAAYIRNATDMQAKLSMPGLFAGMNESWQPLVPKFLIIGVAKAGTTSLYDYLTWHPRVLPAIIKEMNYFGAPERGWEWYLSHFPRRPAWENRFITGEARVGNFDNLTIPRLVGERLPGVKLIAVLRNPADRAISHYYNDKSIGIEKRSLEVAFDEELAWHTRTPGAPRPANFDNRGYLRLGLYALHLKAWLEVFPAKDIHVVISEEFYSAPGREMRKVFKYLGLSEHKSADYKATNTGRYDNQSRIATRVRLMEFFNRHNEELYELLGRRIDWQ